MLHHVLYAPSGISHYELKYTAEVTNQTEIAEYL